MVYLPYCPVLNCLGKQGELSGNCLPNLTVRFILSPSNVCKISDLNGGFQLDDGYLHGGLLDVAARPHVVDQVADLLRVHLAQPVQREVLLLQLVEHLKSGQIWQKLNTNGHY